LVEVVADMIDLANIEEGRVVLRMQDTRLAELMRSAVDSLRPVAERYDIPIEEQYEEDLPPLELDWIKMRHPLVQLLAHALQSTEEGKGIRVRVYREGEFQMVEVRNAGSTVSESEADRMLQMFGQGILRSQRTVGGSGVGLHLLKMMVELHGGRVRIEPGESEGMVYRIRLPRVRDHVTIVSRAA
jgi:signal transduction histidine kinase